MKVKVVMVCAAIFVLMSHVTRCTPLGYGAGGASSGYGGSSGSGSYVGTSGSGGYGGSSGGGGYGGSGSGGYGSSGSGGYGGSSGRYVGSYASEALKNSYNNLDGYNYNFGYNVEDPHYSNYQSRYESGSADPKGQVTGSYTVLDPDGSMRTVDYVADWVNGFRATVRDKNGVTQHGYNTDGGDGSYGGEGSAGGYGSGGAGRYGGAAASGGYGGSSGGGYGGSSGGGSIYGGRSAGSPRKY